MDVFMVCMHGCMGAWMDGWMGGWMGGWVDAYMHVTPLQSHGLYCTVMQCKIMHAMRCIAMQCTEA